MNFLVLHDISGDLLAITMDSIESVGKSNNGMTFIMPKLGSEDNVYLVTETTEEVLGLLQELGCQMIGLKESDE